MLRTQESLSFFILTLPGRRVKELSIADRQWPIACVADASDDLFVINQQSSIDDRQSTIPCPRSGCRW
jgi:hypothetical protein